MFDIGFPELVMILVIALLVFGPGRLPEIGQTLGKGIREFRRATSDVTQEFNEALKMEAPKKPEDTKEPDQKAPPPA
jgi:TatA/E family protein of Tat protein translocase